LQTQLLNRLIKNLSLKYKIFEIFYIHEKQLVDIKNATLSYLEY